MKRVLPVILIVIGAISLSAQTNKIDQLQALEQNQPVNQNITSSSQDTIVTATLKSASRLFADKNDLTSVIVIIPADSIVDVLDSDSSYLHVVYQDNEGYIFKRQATINSEIVNNNQNVQSQNTQSQNVDQNNQQVQEQQQSRLSYLENKYGSNLAARLNAGKIWKGMTAEMVSDSWGTADKINRIIDGNVIKEEWIYRTTWLYFENNTLLEWGPVRKK
jgi:hypothetical protein